MIINILMPTYNDSKTIIESLESVCKQTYDNWHLYIVNDGSTDNTESVIKRYITRKKLSKKITYIYQKNKDQLNALKNGFDHIANTDGLVYVLHSDDTLSDELVFEKAVNYFNQHDIDAIISDYNIMNADSKIVGKQRVKKYTNSFSNIALMGLWLGRNLYVDVAFWKYKVYKEYVYYNYLTWNTPFWLCHEKKLDMLNISNVNFSFFNYRVYEENYINNEIGLLNVLNGELRTLLLILNKLDIPFYRTQYYLFRVFNKLNINYKVLYLRRRTKKIYRILKFVISKRIKLVDLNKYPYFEAILNYYKNINDRDIEIKLDGEKTFFTGADVRAFNKQMLAGKLPQYYYDIFAEMNKGFTTIIVSKKDYHNLIILLKFLDIYYYVKIIKK